MSGTRVLESPVLMVGLKLMNTAAPGRPLKSWERFEAGKVALIFGDGRWFTATISWINTHQHWFSWSVKAKYLSEHQHNYISEICISGFEVVWPNSASCQRKIKRKKKKKRLSRQSLMKQYHTELSRFPNILLKLQFEAVVWKQSEMNNRSLKHDIMYNMEKQIQ